MHRRFQGGCRCFRWCRHCSGAHCPNHRSTATPDRPSAQIGSLQRREDKRFEHATAPVAIIGEGSHAALLATISPPLLPETHNWEQRPSRAMSNLNRCGGLRPVGTRGFEPPTFCSQKTEDEIAGAGSGLQASRCPGDSRTGPSSDLQTLGAKSKDFAPERAGSIEEQAGGGSTWRPALRRRGRAHPRHLRRDGLQALLARNIGA